jgi:hypothetical protein
MRGHVTLQFITFIGLAFVCGLTTAQPCQPTLVESELQTLETATNIAFIDTNWFHTIENLDDINDDNLMNDFDELHAQGMGTMVLNANTGLFNPVRRDLRAIWRGPYVTYQVDRVDVDSTYDRGTLLDLSNTGEVYHLYSPLGLVDPSQEAVINEGYEDNFDRWAFVSAGCDGIFVTSDDRIRQFGGAPLQTVISSVRVLDPATTRSSDEATLQEITDVEGAIVVLQQAPVVRNSGQLVSGSRIQLRGYNLGAGTSDQEVRLDDTPLTDVISWNAREIIIRLPSGAAGITVGLYEDGNLETSFSFPVEVSSSQTWISFE